MMKQFKLLRKTNIFFLIILLVLTPLFLTDIAHAGRSIIFPILGGGSFSNDYYAGRANGIHAATDIFANKGTPLVAAVDGRITFAPVPQPSYGYMVTITDSEGYDYNYIHINNDNPGTDDGSGGPMNAYAPDIQVGNPVVRGQHIGYVGDSGNAENTPPHLHFEIIEPNGNPANPYDSLLQAPRISAVQPYYHLPNEILPYGALFRGGVNVSMGNFDADQSSEYLTGTLGGSAHIRLFDSNNAPGTEFMAYDPKYPVGADVAAGDIDGDGRDEIITGTGGGSPHVRVFRADGAEISGFFAYDPAFSGGVKVAAGDIDGDGRDEIITGPASRGGPHVKVFQANGTLIRSFFAYSPDFQGGIDVAAGDVSGTTSDEILTAPNAGGGPHVRIFNGEGGPLGGFMAYGSFGGGVRLSVGNVRTGTTKAEILTVPASVGSPHIRMFNSTGGLLSEKMFMESWWAGYHDIAAGYGVSKAGTGVNRRVSLRAGL